MMRLVLLHPVFYINVALTLVSDNSVPKQR
jgi:hypothetical protein